MRCATAVGIAVAVGATLVYARWQHRLRTANLRCSLWRYARLR